MAVPATARRLDVLREREVYRLLPQLLDEPSPPLRRMSSDSGSGSGYGLYYRNATDNDHAVLPVSTHDSVLACLAQLGALRLNARRCLVSLFDRHRQLVVAEATQDSHLLSADARALGQTSALLPSSVAVSVVPDLALDPRFSGRPFIAGVPFIRFYAGVSLVSRTGITIGVVCVFDETTRLGLDQAQLDFLHELSRIVTTHLESSQPAANPPPRRANATWPWQLL
ncbi:hypothetical protein Micbo1qcDRAFT_210217 [Microdochium bolleyi]|uniref:GAF domain-containing protein n=1 Tax=Microdochium bolleyi TaxID=196109 RepID=A0A136IJJ6_9PEZI|nr:hypothetical protein Micbo1qcDRAFT_210217 [Microdochium bolleyi]